MLQKNPFILIYHLLEAFLNLYMLYWNCVSDPALYLLQNFCYLTILTHTLICVYCLMVLDYDFQYLRRQGKPSETRYPSHIHSFFQMIHGLGSVVTLAYWGLRLFKPDLLFPEGYNFVPEVLACYSHGGNYLVLAMELLLYEQRIFLKEKEKLIGFCMIIIAYMGIQKFHREVYGYHIYPFLEKMQFSELFSFYAMLFTICVSWDFVFCTVLVRRKADNLL